jgi:superfamily I DNA/RNA helicase/CRISPR/Cas system-associated exonuclease Cas4 (RecB family)
MDDQIRQAAVAAARHLLLLYKAEHPAWTDTRTPVDDLVCWAGLQVETFHATDYPQGTYGFLESGENLIWLCRTLPESLRRFTLAHELGHAALHSNNSLTHLLFRESWQAASLPSTLQFQPELSREDPCQQPDVQEEVVGQNEQELLQEVLGIGQSYNPRSERELAANIFAAELLMPIERIRTLYLREHVPATRLANLFDVSNAAMLNRLVSLATEPHAQGRPQGSPLQTNDEPQSYHGRGDPLWSPSNGLHSSMGLPPNDTKTIAKKQYDEFQKAAIEAPTPALIVAGPGSGKTSTLIGRTEYLINTLAVQPGHILALTFSRKAAQEMQERLAQVLQRGDPRDDNSLAGGVTQHTPTVSTFHAFCAEMLRTYGQLVGLRPDFTVIDDTEGYFLLRQLAGEMPLYHYRNLKSPAYYFPDILKAISRAKDELVSPEQYRLLALRMLEGASDEEAQLNAQKALEVASIYALYQEGLRERGDTDFGGLIMLAVQLLQEVEEVLYEQQQRFHHILVDEFQDINRASGVLLRLLAGEERNVWVVGDANQAIYGFRGASPANIANFQDDYPGAVVLPLSHNYRSRPDIVDLAESFRWRQLELDMDSNPKNAVSTGEEASSTTTRNVQATRLNHAETYVTLASAEDVANELAGLIVDIRYKHAQGYAYKDMAILCRTRAWVGKITRALALAGLPVVEKRGILNQQHIKDLLSIVLLLADASGMGILRAARQPAHLLSQRDIETLLLAAREQPHPLSLMIFNDEAPLRMGIEGRHSLTRLSSMLQSLSQLAPNVWSLLAQYLFMETSTMRDLLIKAESKLENAGAGAHENLQASPLLADYLAFLQLARRYDQQQEARRRRLEQAAEERGEHAAPPPKIREQLKGFLDYLNVLTRLGQDGGDNRRQGTEENSEEEPDIIRVMTVHASKGLEFPVVYLPALIQRNFPLQARANPTPTPVGMVPAGSEGKAAHESGESCLFYVGVTRARDHLVLSYSERNGKQKARATAYLDALLAGLPPERITRLQWQGMIEETYDIEEQDDDRPISLPSTQPGKDFLDTVKPSTLKVSAIETYQRCPRQYLYGTIYGFRSEEDAYQLFWQATHKTLEVLQKHLAESGEQGANAPTVEDAQNLYSQHWQELGGPALPFAAVYERHGHEVAALIHGKLLESGDTNWKLRHDVTVEAAGKTIHLTVDRVEAAISGKAGSTPARFVRARFAKRKEKPSIGTRELLYAQAYRQLHTGQNLELHFHNLSTGETFPITLTAKKEQSLYDDLEQSIQGLERNEFPAKPDSFLCPTCPFFFICPA